MKQLYKVNDIVLVRVYETGRQRKAAIVLEFDPNREITSGYGQYRKTISAPYKVQCMAGTLKNPQWIPENWIDYVVGEASPQSPIFTQMDKHYLNPQQWADMQKLADRRSQWGNKNAQKEFAFLAKCNRWDKVKVVENCRLEEYELYSIISGYKNDFKVRKPSGAVKAFPIDNLEI